MEHSNNNEQKAYRKGLRLLTILAVIFAESHDGGQCAIFLILWKNSFLPFSDRQFISFSS